MDFKIPHIVQYQGSKRRLAPQILQYMPQKFGRLIEPFAGMAAVTVATASEERATQYIVNDLNEPLAKLLEMSVNNPETLSKSYNRLWSAQFNYPDGHIAHFYRVREHFNAGDKNPTNMLYLLARCVKGAVRYGKDGCFNQSPDKRRHGKNPKRITESIHAISHLLKGRTQFLTKDYREIFEISAVGDILYMDPPYQGVTNVRDNRYFSGVDYNDFSESLEILNRKGIDFIISYDGECGGKVYGNELPNTVGCTKLLLNAGLSSQATLLGKRSVTYEALYMSRGLAKLVEHIQKYSISKQITLVEYVYGRSLP